MPRRRDDEIDRLESIQELIEDLWQVPRFARAGQGIRPNVDCFRTGAQLVVIVELAGIDPAETRIEVGERTLVVSGERRRPAVDGEASYQQVEIEYGPFQRRIPLPDDVHPDRAEASYERGILTIRLPLAEKPPEPKRYTITVTVIR
jgi:HSP20 family molecular chaperone IbpA